MKCTKCGTELAPDDRFCGECGAPRPQRGPERSRRVPPRFAEAEQRFAALRTRYQAGELDDAAYEAELQKLVIEDGVGGYWMLGADSGEWYWYDGQQWLRRDPPLAAVAVERPQARPAPPPAVAPPMPAAPPTREGLPWKWIAVGCGGLLVVTVVVVGVLVVPQLLPPGAPLLEPTVALRQPFDGTPDEAQDTVALAAPTATPEPTATLVLTDTPVPPTPIPVPPTDTPTSVPPTDTPTPLPPADTPTPVPPTETPLPLNKIAFVTNRDGNAEIYIMNADGSGVTRLTNNPADDWWPAWSPDGRRIAFASDRDGNMEIYAMNADGSGVTRLTNNPAPDGDPTWSPDGMRIAFASEREVAARSDIWVMNADGSNQVKLREFGVTPVWSPDGSQIAAGFQFGGFMHLGVMPADGSAEPRPLLQMHINNFPTWSPDGSRIAFESTESPDNSEILTINADGSNLVNLTKTPDIVELDPAWSPDGARIAFVSWRDGNAEIYVMNADGSGQTNLTNNPAWDAYPCWSP